MGIFFPVFPFLLLSTVFMYGVCLHLLGYYLYELLLSEHYRSGNSFAQVPLMRKRLDQNPDPSHTSAYGIYTLTFYEQFSYFIFKN